MKNIVPGVFLILILSSANAENIFDVSWNLGNIGMGMNYSSEAEDSIEFSVSVLNVTFEQKDTNIAIEFNPLKYWYLFEFQDEPEEKKTVQNVAL
jgi:hypothetical protein